MAGMMKKHAAAGVAGRGVMFLTVSKAYFMLSGYVIYAGLTRVLTREQFGVYAVATAIVAVLDAVLITGTVQAVSKYVSENPENAGEVKRKALLLQLIIGGGVFLAYFLCAPFVSRFENDPGLTGYFRLSSLIVISYAFYAVYIGYVNGLAGFGKQAALDMTFSTLKTVLVVGFAAAGFGAAGAIGGFGVAAFLVLVIAMAVVGGVAIAGNIGMGRLLHFELFIMLFAGMLNLLLKSDLLLLKKLSAPDVSDTYAAYYAAAQAFAFIPYQAVISITFVIFPLISRLTHIRDVEKAKMYIRETLRYTLIITLLIATLFASSPAATIRLLFPGGYEGGAPVLPLLAFGIVFFSLFLMAATAISGSGRPAHSALLGLGTLVLSVFLNWRLIVAYGMTGAAIGTTIAMFLGMAGSWCYLRRRFGDCLPLFSFLRLAAAAAVVSYISLYVPVTDVSFAGKIALLVKFAVLGLVYIALLFAIRELGPEDIKRIRGIVNVRGRNASA